LYLGNRSADAASAPLISVPAQPAVAVDRFAREIVGFLNVIGGALAAADRQTVSPQHQPRSHIDASFEHHH
jgi:hypothetical protein